MEHSRNLAVKKIARNNRKAKFIRDAMPNNWLAYAEELEEAAEVIWSCVGDVMTIESNTIIGKKMEVKKSSFHARSYILLAGLALENILKAIIITRNPNLISSGQLHNSLKSHKLLILAKKINDLKLTDKEESLLRICQDAIPYWGRYPIPLYFDNLQPAEVATETFRQTFRRLHFRLCKLTYEAIKNGWDSKAGAVCCKIRSRRYGDEIDIKEPLLWTKETKGFDDSHFKSMIVEYLKKFGKAKRNEIDKLIIPKLSDVLTDKQKKSKVGNLLTALRKEDKVKLVGYGTWKLH
jgi:hypothetical protein